MWPLMKIYKRIWETSKKIIREKMFLILWCASILSVMAVLPYTYTLQGTLLKQIPLPVPLYLILFAQIFQGVVQFGIFILVGLYLSKNVGLAIPILESWIKGKDFKPYLKSILGISIFLGIGASILIIGLDFLFSIFGVKITFKISPPIWQGLLASFYGGIGEEVAMRLFLMTILVKKITDKN